LSEIKTSTVMDDWGVFIYESTFKTVMSISNRGDTYFNTMDKKKVENTCLKFQHEVHNKLKESGKNK
jgi:hypothetical protein